MTSALHHPSCLHTPQFCFGGPVGFLAITFTYGGIFPIRKKHRKAGSETDALVQVFSGFGAVSYLFFAVKVRSPFFDSGKLF